MSRCFSPAAFAFFTAAAAYSFAAPTTAPTTAPATAPAALSWEQAATHVGETATVTGPVVGTHVTANKKSLQLNVGKDFPEADRFTILLPYDQAAGDPDTLYKDKTVAVTGKIVLYRKVPEIKATTVTIQK